MLFVYFSVCAGALHSVHTHPRTEGRRAVKGGHIERIASVRITQPFVRWVSSTGNFSITRTRTTTGSKNAVQIRSTVDTPSDQPRLATKFPHYHKSAYHQ